jgi:hypothetical protein
MIDGQFSPIHTWCCGEEEHSIGDVIGLTTARYATQIGPQPGACFTHFTDAAVFQDVGVSPTWEDAVASNAIFRIHPGSVSTDTQKSMFRGGVCHAGCWSSSGSYRADVDNDSLAFLLQKDGDAPPHQIHRASDVDGKHSLPYGIADFANGLSAVHDASTVDEDIEVTPFVHDRVDGGIDLVFIGDVALDVYLVVGSFMFCTFLADVQDGDCCALRLEQ